MKVSIGHSPYGSEELLAVMRVLLSGHMTYGGETRSLEKEWSDYLGTNYSVMVNSGSSANLLALETLVHHRLLWPGNEVIAPAVAWSTSVFPIAQVGCVPVLVDVDPKTFNIDPQRIEDAITDDTRAILIVHLLGNPCDMDAIMDIADRHGLHIIEDCCEAHGASWLERPVGTFGSLSTFSFFWAHHMVSIEGGMVCTNDASWRDTLMSLRSHGWVRERHDADRWTARYPDIDPRWLFVTPGYNVRPTDLNAAFGRVQLRKLDDFVQRRRWLRKHMLDLLAPYGDVVSVQRTPLKGRHSAFGIGVISEDGPNELQQFLEEHGVETRPILAGNLARQPAMNHIRYTPAAGPLGNGTLPVADRIHERGFMLPCHQNITTEQQEYIAECVKRYSG